MSDTFATTPRLKRTGEWVDGETTWYTVTAWRALADNLRDSVRRRDAVIVHGQQEVENEVAAMVHESLEDRTEVDGWGDPVPAGPAGPSAGSGATAAA